MRRRKRGRTAAWVVGVLTLLLFCCFSVWVIWAVVETFLPTGEPSQAEEEGIVVTLLYSPEKSAWLEPLVEEFNGSGLRVGGKPVRVQARAVDSGEALQAILEGERPTVWSPASTLWVPLLNRRWQEQTGATEPLAIYPEPLVVSPLVIAMWEDQARAMGYPERRIGWAEVIAATLDERGWGAYGHPEWGRFKLGHTNPYFSNSGLLSVAAEGYAAAGKVRDLLPEDLERPEARDFVQAVESAVIHYGESTEYFAQQMARRGPAYASAVVLEEQTVVRLNLGAYGKLPQRLVAIYPREGTFWSDHPYVILRGEWVDPDRQAAALAFREFLLSRPAQEKALLLGFRPSDTSIPLQNSLLGPDLGVDPFQPQTVLEVPSAKTLEALLEVWQGVRKRVNILLVVDISGSMSDEGKLAAAQDGLKLFLDQLAEEETRNGQVIAGDRLGIVVFNDRISTLVPLAPLKPGDKERIRAAVDALEADYKTRLYDVAAYALQQMAAPENYDEERINAIVLMTDGLDTASTHYDERSLMREIERVPASGRPVRIFTIAYGSDADRGLLERLAEATEGRMVEGTPENIRRLYVILSSYF
ncbi:MAG: extracellular solute-binding protein [Chloroflexia bacterium]